MNKKQTTFLFRNPKKRIDPKKDSSKRQVLSGCDDEICVCVEKYKNAKRFPNVDPELLTKDFSSYFISSNTSYPRYSVTTHAFAIAPKKTLRPCCCVLPCGETHLTTNKNTYNNNQSKFKISIPPSRPKSGLKISCNNNSANGNSKGRCRNRNLTRPKDSILSFNLQNWLPKCDAYIKENDFNNVVVNKKRNTACTFKEEKIVNVSEHLPQRRKRALKDCKVVYSPSKKALLDGRMLYEKEKTKTKQREFKYDQNLSERRKSLKDYKVVSSWFNKSFWTDHKDEDVKMREKDRVIEFDQCLSEKHIAWKDRKIIKPISGRSVKSIFDKYREESERMTRKRAELEYVHSLLERRRRDFNDGKSFDRSYETSSEDDSEEGKEMIKKQSELEYDQARKFKENYRRVLYNEGIDDDAISQSVSFHIGPLPILMGYVSDDNVMNTSSNDVRSRFKLIS